MKIAVPYENGQVAQSLAACRQFLIVTAENGDPTAKELAPCADTSSTAMLKLIGLHQIDVLICGELGISTRNALEMLGVLLIPGVSGPCEEAVAKFLTGEQQGDPTVLTLCREEDPDDPMNCMHDCSKCAGCGPISVPDAVREHVPKI